MYDVNAELIAKSVRESNISVSVRIPEEFRDELKSGFSETFDRVLAELGNKGELFVVGKYEIETLVMLKEALKQATLITRESN